MLFDSLDVKTQRFLVGAIFFCVFLLLLAFFRSHSPPTPAPGGLMQATPIPEPTVDICDRAVMGSCEVEVQEVVPDCSNESKAIDSVADKLSNPIESEVCKAAQLELGERCAKGCLLDYGTVVLIPGKVQADVFPAQNNKSCKIRAQRSLNMQGRCVSAGNEPPPEPTQLSPSPE